ncbi:MAG: VWA domain-containing protein [Proteobacteria bacterium]|nr:VWA domain-containing protein [Pseudomonadota bacterium]
MLVRFFLDLRAAGVPVALNELLLLLEALQAGVARPSALQFYHLARACLVKDERYYDRFDLVFTRSFAGAELTVGQLLAQVPAQWLEHAMARFLSEEEKRRVQALGGWQKLLDTLRERLAEQQGRHSGGNKWIGTGGTSPFGSHGFNPEGIRMGGEGGQRRAVKVWEERAFRNLDDAVELGTRNLKLALRRLRRFAREGAADQLDLPGTIEATARRAGLLDLRLVPQRRNAVKVLLFLDVGGSMDEHVRVCEQLFSAARSEFQHLHYFYFHNCIYERLWQDSQRRAASRIDTTTLLRTYGRAYRVVVVGDASMSPYEITQPGGSIEHWNAEAGAVWLQRLCAAFPHLVWLNPAPTRQWEYGQSIQLVRELLGGRMFPLTLAGLDQAIAALRRAAVTPLAPPPPPAATPVTSAGDSSAP